MSSVTTENLEINYIIYKQKGGIKHMGNVNTKELKKIEVQEKIGNE